MRISIFGLGYVGAVCTACLAERGHQIVGVDVAPQKIALVNQGRSPIVEPHLDDYLARGVAAGRIEATDDARRGVLASAVSMVCVGTPSRRNGDLELDYIRAVCEQIGQALRDKLEYHTVVIRSTVLPGTIKEFVIPLLEEHSGKQAGADFGVAANPEFLREGSAIHDFNHPSMTVIGELDQASGDLLASLYADLEAPVIRKSIEVAEMIKYTCNVWHALKVSFANEIGNIAKAVGVDGREVMEVVCADRKLNVSDYYMRPGFAFGGSCLPKDVRALTYRASRLDVHLPLLGSIMVSNRNQIQNAFDMIQATGARRVAMLGLAFKAGTDDLRESPLVELAEMMIGKGYELAIYDQKVEYARVNGKNKEFIESRIPHVSSLLRSDLEEVVRDADVIVLGNNDPRFKEVVHKVSQGMMNGKKVVDLVGFADRHCTEAVEGICW